MKKLLGILVLGLILSGSTFAKQKDWAVFNILDKKGGIDSIIALCLNEKNLNKVTLSHFNNLSEYKKNASFRNGECNYVVDRFLNPRLFQFLLKTKLNKGKHVIKKKLIDKRVTYTNEIYYVTPEGKFIEVVSLEFKKEPTQSAKSMGIEVFAKKEEEKRKADAKKEEKKRIAEEKGIAEEKRKADAKKEEEQKIIVKKKLKNQTELLLINPLSEIEKAQNYINDIQDFVRSNPEEYDILKIAEFMIANKVILKGTWNEEQAKKIELFKQYANKSKKFLNFHNKKNEERIQISLNRINTEISRLENHITEIKKYLQENLTSEFAPQALEKVKLAQQVLAKPHLKKLLETNKEMELAIKSFKEGKPLEVIKSAEKKKTKTKKQKTLEQKKKELKEKKQRLAEKRKALEQKKEKKQTNKQKEEKKQVTKQKEKKKQAAKQKKKRTWGEFVDLQNSKYITFDEFKSLFDGNIIELNFLAPPFDDPANVIFQVDMSKYKDSGLYTDIYFADNAAATKQIDWNIMQGFPVGIFAEPTGNEALYLCDNVLKMVCKPGGIALNPMVFDKFFTISYSKQGEYFLTPVEEVVKGDIAYRDNRITFRSVVYDQPYIKITTHLDNKIIDKIENDCKTGSKICKRTKW